MAQYAGMTVNERLALSGMNFCFEEAAAARDRTKMIEILVALEMETVDAGKVVDVIFSDPETYGTSCNSGGNREPCA